MSEKAWLLSLEDVVWEHLSSFMVSSETCFGRGPSVRITVVEKAFCYLPPRMTCQNLSCCLQKWYISLYVTGSAFTMNLERSKQMMRGPWLGLKTQLPESPVTKGNSSEDLIAAHASTSDGKPQSNMKPQCHDESSLILPCSFPKWKK